MCTVELYIVYDLLWRMYLLKCIKYKKNIYNKLLCCIVNKKVLRSVVLNLVVFLFRYLRLIVLLIIYVEKNMLYIG